MANKVGNASKHRIDSRQNTFSHIMNQRDRITVSLFYLPQKGDEQLSLFRWHFDIIQDNLSNAVYSGKKMRAVGFTGAVNVQNVAPSGYHRLF